MKRYIKEYSSDKIRSLRELAKEYPNQADDFARMIDAVNKAVWLHERGYIITDECMRLISNV